MDELSLRQLNGDEDEDEALRRALALSMGETDGTAEATVVDVDDAAPNASSRGHVRSLSDATTASEASTAPTASTASATSEKPPSPEPVKNEVSSNGASEPAKKNAPTTLNEVPTAAASAPPAPTSTMSLLGLDRKAMEAERLARRQKALEAQQKAQGITVIAEGAPETKVDLAQSWKLQPSPAKKRKAEDDVIVIDDDDVVEIADDSKDKGKGKDIGAKTTQLPDTHAARRRKLDTDIRTESKGNSSSAPAQGSVDAKQNLPYAKGVVKKTWVRGQPRKGDDITLEEIWQKDTLELAVLSSFQWDEDWMLAKLDMPRTRIMLIAFAVDEQQKENMKANSQGSNIRFCFPPMQTMGCMHSKLQLLKFPGHLRIVVPTGNLVPYDWGENGLLENMVFIIDLPKLPKGTVPPEGSQTPFLEDLAYFLTAQGVDAPMVNSLRNYDFSQTAPYAFVHSMAGSYMDDAWKRTGYSGLGRAVKALGWATNSPIQADYITASVGSISNDLINALYNACQGDSGLKELEARSSKPRGAKGKNAISFSAPNQNSPKNRLRMYFPSEETVDNSLGGRNGAGTICFQRKWWDAATFPHTILRDVQSVRKGVLLHTKLLLVRTRDSTKAESSDKPSHPPGWAYVGSANMSESAWGRMVKDRASGKTKMTCRNWECGVLVPASVDDDNTNPTSMGEDEKMFDIFRNTLPVPIEVPGTKYTDDSGEKKKPWFFLEA